MSDAQVLVAGGGLTGSLAACMLHDRGAKIAIVDAAGEVMQRASRWNEGKIHLGYTYVGTDSTQTAELMLAGAATFLPTIERVTGAAIPDQAFTSPITYIVDRNSLFPPDVLWARSCAVHALVRAAADGAPGLIPGGADCATMVRLDPDEAAEATGQQNIAAAWTTPERALSARVLSEQIEVAVRARGIPVIPGRVVRVARTADQWRMELESGESLQAPSIVNALWESRSAIDAGLAPAAPTSIRWKAGVFATGQTAFAGVAPSTRILGAYGDVTPYANGDVYLSWYPSNMIARSDTGTAPDVPAFDETVMKRRTLEGLRLPHDILLEGDGRVEVRGGYVVARGHGDIRVKESPLHDRSRAFATELAPGYVSVDTGKLTTAPLLAERAARLALAHLEIGDFA
ncbi:FAD-binding oxidoreductase [Silicimonas algicola]|uniref:FAD dependent oxidoreductase n=1 Tax=Silicimonas algicola TaxID=1826607 RepID=A0A316G4T9_9RHOB|nr:FAD-dependent oxidoreductase [Silicimonas algicola]AZQ68451.1 FAD-binding oxidoreductase [Silicimonas algicola]PWK55848.1 FAD dependent oxidoreductase [Silicimonas algicola]